MGGGKSGHDYLVTPAPDDDSTVALTLTPPAGGTVLLGDRYELGEFLGSGGVADVYRAQDLLLGRPVAVKFYGPGIDPNAPERERIEMRTLAGLSHPNLVTVHDAGTDTQHTPPRAYLVMALIDGPTLGDLGRKGPLPPDQVRRVAKDVAGALAYVHSRGVVHRDVKPGNILLDSDGVAYLADFGVALTIGASALTAVGQTVGTAAYLSPEQVLGQEVTPAADVYALGLVLLEVLSGEREYVGTTTEAALARLSRPPRIAGRVPDGWSDLLTRMTLSDPLQRPTAEEVVPLLDVQQVAAQPDSTRLLTTVQPTISPPPVLPRRASGQQPAWRRHVPLLLLGALLLLVLIAVVSSRGPSAGGPVPQAPAGTPGPARLGPDLTRLHQLVTS